MEWMILPFKRYAEFSGRSRRMEFWMFTLLNVIVYVVLAALVFGLLGFGAASDPNEPMAIFAGLFTGAGLLFVLWWLIVLIPTVAVGVRRLHDRDMSGWWYLGFIAASLIPLVGFIASIAMLVIFLLPGTAGPNRFGPDPKDPSQAEAFA